MTDMTEDIINPDLDLNEEDIYGTPLYHVEPRLTIQKEEATKIYTVGDAVEYVCEHVRTLTHEASYAIFLDISSRVAGFSQVGQGIIDCTSISTAKILQCMLLTGSKYLILIHNHPCRTVAYPSYLDTYTARRISHALGAVDNMVLEDFIIVTPTSAKGRVYSMKLDALLNDNPCRCVDENEKSKGYKDSKGYKEYKQYIKQYLTQAANA